MPAVPQTVHTQASAGKLARPRRQPVGGPVGPAWSPRLDIQGRSNFERLLFDRGERDPAALTKARHAFRETGRMPVSYAVWHRDRGVLHGFRLDDSETEAEIRRLHAATGYLADPHTAIGIAAARAHAPGQGLPTAAMATAHAAKFPDAMERATGIRPPLPPRVAQPFERQGRSTGLLTDLGPVLAKVWALCGRNPVEPRTRDTGHQSIGWIAERSCN